MSDRGSPVQVLEKRAGAGRLGTVPVILRDRPQWVVWRVEEAKGRRRKVPYCAGSGARASSADPNTWASFEEAVAAWESSDGRYLGVGFVFAPEDPFCGVDLDDCRDPATGDLAPWAQEIVKELDSYTEVSPSGSGVKIFLCARKPGGRCKARCETGEVEIYDKRRFFTVTGERLALASSGVEERQKELESVYARVFGGTEGGRPDITALAGPEPAGSFPPLTDDEILEKASSSRRGGEKFRALWTGRWGDHFGSPSEADGSVVFTLAYYTKDPEQIDRLFRRSGLMRPKWDERRGEETYGRRTVRKALETVTAQYEKRACRAVTDEGETEGEAVPLGSVDPGTGRLVLSARRTLPTAEAFVREFFTRPEGRTLHSWAGLLMAWRDNRYAEMEDEAARHGLLPWLHEALRCVTNRKTGALELRPFEANPSTVKAALESVRAYVHQPAGIEPPAWLDGGGDRPDPLEVLPCRTMNLHIPSGEVLPATPALFNTNALDFDYDPGAPEPVRWLAFLEEIFGDDPEAVGLLQEWFGYCLTADTAQQKMLMLVGPKRCGKGTIGRLLARLVGHGNVCGPTISSLAGSFGLQPLLGKSLAIVSDARFAGEHVSTVIERLLCISGEDALTVDRKHLTSVTLKLSTRMMFLTNELPRIADASGALAGRFLVLRFTRSFFGQEDLALGRKLAAERPGILLWSLAGWRRLHARGHFLQPQSAAGAVEDLEELTSPVSAFVRQRCAVAPGLRIWVDDLYRAWTAWCQDEGRSHPTTKASFGRDLAAAMPAVAKRRNRGEGTFYEGIALR